jgi:hypothetical protein
MLVWLQLRATFPCVSSYLQRQHQKLLIHFTIKVSYNSNSNLKTAATTKKRCRRKMWEPARPGRKRRASSWGLRQVAHERLHHPLTLGDSPPRQRGPLRRGRRAVGARRRAAVLPTTDPGVHILLLPHRASDGTVASNELVAAT